MPTEIKNNAEIPEPENSFQQFSGSQKNETYRKLNTIIGQPHVFTAKPTGFPKTFEDSFGFWNDSGTMKLVMYNYLTNSWYYFTGTLIT